MKSLLQLLWLVSLWGTSQLVVAAPQSVSSCANPTPLVLSSTCQPQKIVFLDPPDLDGVPSNSGMLPFQDVLGAQASHWFQFIATSTDINIQLATVGLNKNWRGVGYEIYAGSCNGLQSVAIEFHSQLPGNQFSSVARGLTVGQSYYLMTASVGYWDSASVCVTPATMALPRTMISTRRGGSWYSPSTWLAGRVPMLGDTVIINDSATVFCSSNNSFQTSLVTVGRGLTTHKSRLSLSNGGITNLNKFTVLRPQDMVSGPLTIKGDLEFNGNVGSRVITDQTIIKYQGRGTRRVTRSPLVPPMDSLNIHTVMQCKACTTTINFPWIACGGLYLDSGYFNPTVAFVHAARGYGLFPYYLKQTHQIIDGQYIGVPATGALSGLKVLYPSMWRKPSIKRRFAGLEWPTTNTLAKVEAENIDSLVGNPNLKVVELGYQNTHLALAADSVEIEDGSFSTAVRELDTMRLGSIGTKVINTGFGYGTLSIGKQRNFRTLSYDVGQIQNYSRSGIRFEYFDQKPSDLNPGTVAPLSRLIGRHYIRILQASRPTDSLNLYFHKNVNDSIQIFRNDLVIAQSPHPTGPWKMVGVRDSLLANRNVRMAKITFADGEYFTWGSLDRPYEAELRFMDWPAYYRAGCSNSIGLPLRYIFRNTGTLPLDSLEFGFRTDLEYRTQWVRLRKPLQPYTDDTLVLEGPQGANMTAAQTYNTAAWISHPGFQNRGDDTSYQVLNAAPQPLPWYDNLDSYGVNSNLNLFNTRNRRPLINGWEFDYSVPKLLGYSIGYWARNNNVLQSSNTAAPFGVVMPPIRVNAGRIYTYERIFTDAAMLARDTIYMQYTLDCGATWRTYRKHKLGDVTGITGTVERRDSIDILQSGAIAFKVWHPRRNPFGKRILFVGFTVSSLATSLPALQSQSPTQYWYPNPTTGVIKFTGKAEQLVSVFNMMGHLVLQRKIQPDQSIDLSAQPPGLYLIKGPEGTNRVVRE